jgi:aryl-alcohol dehydrogenase-like predicted oxidoreductase
MIWSPLAGGLLSGKHRRGERPPEGSRHAGQWDEPPVYDEDKLYDTVDVLVEIASNHRVSPARVALAWLLGRPGITTVIVGARTDEQLADNLAAAELELRGEDFIRLEEVSRPPLLYPFWHQFSNAADRLSAADLSLIGPHLSDPSLVGAA